MFIKVLLILFLFIISCENDTSSNQASSGEIIYKFTNVPSDIDSLVALFSNSSDTLEINIISYDTLLIFKDNKVKKWYFALKGFNADRSKIYFTGGDYEIFEGYSAGFTIDLANWQPSSSK